MRKRTLLLIAIAVAVVVIAVFAGLVLWVMIGPGVPVCSGKTVMFVLFPGFRYEEYEIPKLALSKLGARILTACPGGASVVGLTREGKTVTIECDTDLSKRPQSDVVVLVGGPGLYCLLTSYLSSRGEVNTTMPGFCDYIAKSLGISYGDYYDDLEKVIELVRRAHAEGEVVAAVCIAPAILCLADIVHSVNITMAHLDPVMSYVAEKCNLNIVDKPVVVVDRVVTARGPEERALQGLVLALVELVCRQAS